MDLKSKQTYSRYILDYLRHNAGLSINHGIIKGLTASWQANFQYRNGNYVPYTQVDGKWAFRKAENYKPFLLFDLKLNYKIKSLGIYVQVKNMFDKKHQNIENVFLPGRWISGGISYSVDFKRKQP